MHRSQYQYYSSDRTAAIYAGGAGGTTQSVVVGQEWEYYILLLYVYTWYVYTAYTWYVLLTVVRPLLRHRGPEKEY